MITLEREAPSKVSDHAYDLTRADLERLLWQDTEDSLQRPGWLTGQGNWAGFSQKVQTFSYKITKLWGSNVQHGDYC